MPIINNNILNKVFTLEYFLIKRHISPSIIEFAKENGLDINYKLFTHTLWNNIYYVVTIDHKLISIDCNDKNENNIEDYRKHNLAKELYITYNGLRIIVSKKYNSIEHLIEYNNKIGIKNKKKQRKKILNRIDNFGYMNLLLHNFASNIDLSALKKIVIIKERTLYLVKDLNIEVIIHKKYMLHNLVKNNWNSLTLISPYQITWDATTFNNIHTLNMLKSSYDDIPSIPSLINLKLDIYRELPYLPNLETLKINKISEFVYGPFKWEKVPKLKTLILKKSCSSLVRGDAKKPSSVNIIYIE